MSSAASVYLHTVHIAVYANSIIAGTLNNERQIHFQPDCISLLVSPSAAVQNFRRENGWPYPSSPTPRTLHNCSNFPYHNEPEYVQAAFESHATWRKMPGLSHRKTQNNVSTIARWYNNTSDPTLFPSSLCWRAQLLHSWKKCLYLTKVINTKSIFFSVPLPFGTQTVGTGSVTLLSIMHIKLTLMQPFNTSQWAAVGSSTDRPNLVGAWLENGDWATTAFSHDPWPSDTWCDVGFCVCANLLTFFKLNQFKN